MTVVLLWLRTRKVGEAEVAPFQAEVVVEEVHQLVLEAAVLLSWVASSLVACRS